MPRILLAALALACVCSPALSMSVARLPDGYPPPEEYRLAAWASLMAAVISLCVRTHPRRSGSRGRAAGGAVLMVLFAVPCAAAEVATVGDTAVILPYGQWIAAIAQTATEILVPIIIIAAIGVAARKLPWYASMWFTTQRIDRMVKLAADYALNSVAGATAGKAVTVDVGYTVIKVGLERALGSSPQWLIDAAGGTKGITERLFRAFHFDETVTDKNTLLPLQRDLGVVEPLTEKRYPPPTADELRDAERMSRN